jgi:DNA-binding NarL/FixJ family response regulator
MKGMDMTAAVPVRALRLAIVESAPMIELGIRTITGMSSGFVWAGCSRSLPDAIELCRDSGPDVLLIGSWTDPDWSIGAALTRCFPGLAFVAVLTRCPDSRDRAIRARRSGARAVLSASVAPADLRDALRAVASGASYLDPQFESQPRPVTPLHPTRGKPLSNRELEVLAFIAEGRTAGYIGNRLGITAETVRTHVSHILKKLSARDRAHAVALAIDAALLPGRSAGRLLLPGCP